MSIINYQDVETKLEIIENIIVDCDHEEKLLLIKFLHERTQKTKRRQVLSDDIGNMNIGGLITKIKKHHDAKDGEE